MKTKLAINPTIWQHLESLEAEEPGFLIELLETFAIVTPVSLQKLQAAWTSRDFKALGKTAHSLKSSCQALGGTEASERLAEVEQWAVHTPEKLTDETISTLTEAVRELCAEFIARKTALAVKRSA